jgi:RecA/RadA recombinase
MDSLPFLKRYKNQLAKIENVSTDFRPPLYFLQSGNYAINRVLSGDYHRCIPQGRITLIAGPSDAGKSYVVCNIMANAQKIDDAFVLAIDSEHALDPDYLKRVDVNTSPERFLGVEVITISDIIQVTSSFISSYEKEYGKYNPAAPKVLIIIDSLDMLMTESEANHFEKGEQAGDQGQRAKQLKAFLRTLVSKIKALNISVVATHQVYPADVKQGEGVWKINNAIRYSCSQIGIITKLKLKEGSEQVGIRMYVETFKSRFAKPGTWTEIMVPYDTGMSPYSGLIELLKADGVIQEPSVGWMSATFPNLAGGADEFIKFQKSGVNDELASKLLAHPKLKAAASQFEDSLRQPEQEEIDPASN